MSLIAEATDGKTGYGSSADADGISGKMFVSTRLSYIVHTNHSMYEMHRKIDASRRILSQVGTWPSGRSILIFLHQRFSEKLLTNHSIVHTNQLYWDSKSELGHVVTWLTVYAVQLYWGSKSELGHVVTRLSEVYESAKRDAVRRLRLDGMETIAIGNSDVNTASVNNVDAVAAGNCIATAISCCDLM